MFNQASMLANLHGNIKDQIVSNHILSFSHHQMRLANHFAPLTFINRTLNVEHEEV